jgi:hypothetical protein
MRQSVGLYRIVLYIQTSLMYVCKLISCLISTGEIDSSFLSQEHLVFTPKHARLTNNNKAWY